MILNPKHYLRNLQYTQNISLLEGSGLSLSRDNSCQCLHLLSERAQLHSEGKAATWAFFSMYVVVKKTAETCSR
jgi:hypothetical protein